MTPTSKYLSTIDKGSFEDCLTFVNSQLSSLGVPISNNQDAGQILADWARHLATKSSNTYSIFNIASKGVTNKSPKEAISKQRAIHNRLVGRKVLDLSILDPNLKSLTDSITSHPFYARFQRTGLEASNRQVQETFAAFQKIDSLVRKVESATPRIAAKLRALQIPNLNLDNLHIPTDISNPNLIADNLNSTAQLLKNRKPEMYYSSAAISALADAAAKEIYADWCKALVIVDISLSRYYTIAYFGILLDTVVELKNSTGIVAALHQATNKEIGTLLELASGLAK
jgi:hypothetical protein